ncbi:MAG: OmpA family protein [Gammaproteobacteria bacterium]|nr:OmpA family protein [Gammaproteobacteria bacterium]MDH5802205.1 OmpA family protein [Gammaproteobacteria bacterium]
MEVKLSQPERILTETPEKSRFHFDANQTEISADDLEILQQHATYLMNNPGLHLVLEAHSDAQGSAAYNYKLSEKRAEKVVNILLQYGVSSDLITVNNYGESFPLHEENNWKENRRVEFKYEEATVPSDLVVSSY